MKKGSTIEEAYEDRSTKEVRESFPFSFFFSHCNLKQNFVNAASPAVKPFSG